MAKKGMRSIGAVITLEGEQQFRKATTQCNDALKTMQTEMRLVNEQYKDQANSMAALQSKQSTLTKTLARAVDLQDTLQDALKNANNNYDRAGESLADYRHQLADAETALASLQQQQAQDAGTDMSAQIEEQTKAVEQLQGIVGRAERAYDRAGAAVQTWTQKLNNAQADVIRLGRELDDTTRYLREAESASDGMATSIDATGKKVTKATSAMADNVGDAADAIEDMSDNVSGLLSADIIKDYADSVSEAFASVASAAYEASRELDGAYKLVSNRTGAAGADLEQYKGIVDNIYGDMPADLEAIGQAVGETARSFDAPADKVEALSRKLVIFGQITGEDIPDTVRGANRILTAFGDGMAEAGDLLDTLAQEAQTNGIRIDDVLDNTLTNAAAFKSLDLSSSGAVRFMGELMEAGIEAESAVSALENAYDFTQEEGLNFRDTLYEVNDAMKQGNAVTQSGVRVQEFFGDGFAKMTDVVRSGNVDFREMTQRLQGTASATGYLEQAFDNSLSTFDTMDVAMQRLRTTGGGLARSALDTLAPAIDALADVLQSAGDAFDDMPDGVKKTVAVMGLLATGAGALAPKIIAVKAALDALRAAKGSADAIKGVADALSVAGDAAEAATDAAKAAAVVGTVAETATDGADALADVAVAATTAGTAMQVTAAGSASLGASLASVAAKFAPAALAIGAAGAVLAGLKKVTDDHAESVLSENKAISEAMDTADRAAEKTKQTTTDARNALAAFAESVGSVSATSKAMAPVVNRMEELGGRASYTAAEMDELESGVRQLNAAYPGLNLELDRNTGSFMSNGAALSDLSDYLDQYSASLENAAVKNNLQKLTDQKVANSIDIEFNKQALQDMEQQLGDMLQSLDPSLTFEQFRRQTGMNFLDKASLWAKMTFITRDGFDGKAFNEVYSAYNELFNETEKLIEAQEEVNAKLESTQGLMADTSRQTLSLADSVAQATDGISGHGAQVDAVVSDYAELSVRMEQAGQDVSAVSAALEAEQSRLGPLFAETAGAWQAAHDEIMAGLSGEAGQIATNAETWQGYRDAVQTSLDDVQSMFAAHKDETEASWGDMTAALQSNADAQSAWLANATTVLSSARYQTDETFRELANRILLGGQEASGYLQEFVANVDLSTTQATGDIQTFAEGLGISEAYSGLMANLQLATADGLDGIAAMYDGMASQAEQSLNAMSGNLQKQADIYTQYADAARGLVESERYKSDADFRAYTNTLLAQGVAGAEQVALLWEGLQSGSSQVDAAVQSYLALSEATGKYADAWASVQLATKDGVDGTVSIVDSAQDALGLAAANDAAAIAAGLDNDAMTVAIQQATDKVLMSLHADTTQEAYEQAGRSNAEAYVEGYQGVMANFEAERAAMRAANSTSGSAFGSKIAYDLMPQNNTNVYNTANFSMRPMSGAEADALMYSFFRSRL